MHVPRQRDCIRLQRKLAQKSARHQIPRPREQRISVRSCMESSIDAAAASLRKMRERLRNMQRQATRSKKAAQRISRPTLHLKLRAVLMFSLCRDATLTMQWALRFRRYQNHTCGTWCVPLSEASIQSWVHNYSEHPLVQEALESLNHVWRRRADEFLLESLVWEEVVRHNSNGLKVPSSALVQSYIRKWHLRPRSAATDADLNKLQADPTRARKWCFSFRRRWSLQWGPLVGLRTLSRDAIQRRAGIYLRWIRYVCTQPSGTAGRVIVAMDETAVTNVMNRGMQGTVVCRQQQSNLRQSQPAAPRALGRTALVAAVCNDNDIQQHLPQIWLPRSDPEKIPPAATRAVFTAAGDPHEAWHGSTGFCTQSIIRAWLRKLKRRVLSRKPGVDITVVLDVCPVHVAPSIAAEARRLKIDIVLVPARLTWLLQLLDTHVFAQLKREMRKELWQAKASSAGGTISAATHLQALTRATSKVLVQRSWTKFFPRVGLDGTVHALRPSLATLVQGVDLEPRMPTQDELAEILGAHRTNVAPLHGLLCSSRQPTERQPACSAAAADAADSCQAADEDDPVLTPLAHTMATRLHTRAPQAAGDSSSVVARIWPRARRLLPCPRNLHILPPPPAPPHQRVATRSMRPKLVTGVVGSLKRKRTADAPFDSLP